MTSELRPAMEVWRDAYDAFTDFYHHTTEKDPARVIEADREAVRAEQAAELAQLRGELEAANEVIAEQLEIRQRNEAELAKFKALAETLATDLQECARALQSLHQIPGTGADGRLWQRIKEITGDAHAAVAQYKEARDAS